MLERVDADGFARRGQSVEACEVLAGLIVPDVEEVFSSESDHAQRPLGRAMPRPGLCRVEADPTLGARSAVFTDAA